MRAHEVIASPTSLYEVLETLGERRRKKRERWATVRDIATSVIRAVRAAVS